MYGCIGRQRAAHANGAMAEFLAEVADGGGGGLG